MDERISQLEAQINRLMSMLDSIGELKSQVASISAKIDDAQNVIHNHTHQGYDRSKKITSSTVTSIVNGDCQINVLSDEIQISAGSFPINIGNGGVVNIEGTSLSIATPIGAGGGDVIVGGGIITTATDGFLYIPSCSGAPSGTPANAGNGTIPIVYDSTNNKLYAYNGAWKSVTLT